MTVGWCRANWSGGGPLVAAGLVTQNHCRLLENSVCKAHQQVATAAPPYVNNPAKPQPRVPPSKAIRDYEPLSFGPHRHDSARPLGVRSVAQAACLNDGAGLGIHFDR